MFLTSGREFQLVVGYLLRIPKTNLNSLGHMIDEGKHLIQTKVLRILLLRFEPARMLSSINTLLNAYKRVSAHRCMIYLGQEINQAFKHVFTILVTIVIRVEVNHETGMS